MSDDAQAFLAALARSRTEHVPGRMRAAVTTSPRCRPIVPASYTSGVSRMDIQARLRRWGLEWTMDRITAVVAELVDAGTLRRGPLGIYAGGAA